jgi:outer membrane protein assembly factor BamD (BamD/ComL family)
VLYSIEDIENVKAVSDSNEVLTPNSIITAYNNFLKKHPNQQYEEKAKKRIDELSFSIAEKQNTINSYEKYVLDFPNGQFAEKAKNQIEYLYFNEVKSKDTISAYKTYLSRYPNGTYKEKATNRIEDIYFEERKQKDTIAAYHEYLREYPSGKYISIARNKIEEIEKWQEARKVDNTIYYKTFLTVYPNSKFKDEANARIHYLEILQSDSIDSIKNFLSNYRNYSSNYSKYISSSDKNNVLERLELISSEKKSSSGFSLLYEETNKSEYLNLAFALIKDKYDEEYFAKKFPYKFFGVKSLNPYDKTDTDTKYGLFGGTTYIGSVQREYNPTIHSGAKYGTYKVKIKFSLKTETIKKYFGIAWYCPADEKWTNTYTEYATF